MIITKKQPFYSLFTKNPPFHKIKPKDMSKRLTDADILEKLLRRGNDAIVNPKLALPDIALRGTDLIKAAKIVTSETEIETVLRAKSSFPCCPKRSFKKSRQRTARSGTYFKAIRKSFRRKHLFLKRRY